MCVGLGRRGCEVEAGTLESEVPDGELGCLKNMPMKESWGKGGWETPGGRGHSLSCVHSETSCLTA